MGCDLDPEYSGHGIMTEATTAMIKYAFSRMKVNRVRPWFLRETRDLFGLSGD